jgi:hypothetical protein
VSRLSKFASVEPQRDPATQIGAYGLRLAGLDAAALLLVPARPEWPLFKVASKPGRASSRYDRVGDDRACLALQNGGEIEIDRTPGRIVFRLPDEIEAPELVHPYLAPAAAVIAPWFGRESFHAGAFVTGGGVWALVGEREAGKSSTLAWLALRGYDVVCDDILVVEGMSAFAGPRSIDLRGEAARYLGAGEPLGTVGVRERWRVQLGPVAEELTMRGWVFLAWSERVEAAPLSGAERLRRLFANRGARLPPTRPALLLDLADLPGWELRRPPGWGSLPAAGERLLEIVAR